MDHAISVFRKMFSMALISGISVLVAGCSVTASRTVALPGLAPLAGGDQVRLVEKLEDAGQPYQIVGQVRISSNGPLYEGASYKRMKDIAAGMGADGLLGTHWSNNGQTFFRSGLAVKWLAPGEAKQPLKVPFIVAVLPIKDQAAPDKEARTSDSLRQSVLYPLETKGYYVLPAGPSDFKGGIEKAKSLSDAELQALGGEEAQLLLGVTIEASASANVVVMSGSSMSVRTTLLDKRTRNTVFERVGTGSASAGWLVNAMVPDEKHNMAACAAVQGALGSLPAIHEEVSN